MKISLSTGAWFVAAAVVLGVAFTHRKWEKPQAFAPISWDVSGYYLYLPAFFIYKDPSRLRFFEDIRRTYHPSPIFDQAFEHRPGRYIMKYSAGMALLYLPGFGGAHLWATLSDAFPADGYSFPYQFGLSLWGLVVALLGLWLLRLNLLRFFGEGVSGVTLVLIALGTNYFNYVTYDVLMPHNFLFTLYALLVWLSIRWYTTPRKRTALAIGAVCGLLALARPSEVISVLVPLGMGLHFAGHPREWLRTMRERRFHLLLAGLAMGAVGFIQLLYWKVCGGEWVIYSYQDQGFDWLKPHFANVFFSYRKGWLIYTPLMAFALAGLWMLYRRYRWLFWGLLPFLLLNTYIICSWEIWWYGGGFGQRAFIQSYPLLAFPLAAFIQWSHSRRRRRWLFYPLLGFCLVLNQFQIWQAQNYILDTMYTNRAFYWRIFGKTRITPRDRLLMDTKEDFRGERKGVHRLFASDFENFPEPEKLDSTYARSGKWAMHVGPSREFSPAIEILRSELPPEAEYLRADAWFFTQKMEWEPWWMPQFTVQFWNGDRPVKTRSVRPFR
ncbi:MAG: hypothetical protein D6765_11020, partial [Bacteroidetes bacterium]